MDFHSFANEHNIIFDNDEWEEYSNKMKKILEEKDDSCIYIDTTGFNPTIKKEIQKNEQCRNRKRLP